VGGNSVDDDVLKSQTGWNNDVTDDDAEKLAKSQIDWDGNGSGTDNVGFSALPAGYRWADNGFGSEGYSAYFWSTTDGYGSTAYRMNLYYFIKKASQYYFINDPDDPMNDYMLRHWNLSDADKTSLSSPLSTGQNR
jgi:Fibrobacter succinogenes major domain (Fib_succ_major).